MPLQPGQVLNSRYRIVRLLGQGGFGAVYRAWDTNLNRPCAVKENLDTSPEAQRQFMREATVLANLSHPNLPRVTDHFILPAQGQYLVMDFVEGEDLASLIKRQGSVPPEQALAWVSQVADALTYLHNRQPPVVHRDVKPSNIRLTPDGRAMLVDFGLVKLYDPHLHTTMGARAVTPGYAPPEQYGQGKTDGRTDQYALAATLYNLLTGNEPMESVQRMAGGQMRLTHQINPRVPPPVSMAIERSMRLEPSQRFTTVSEFKNALAAAVSAAPGMAARQSPDIYVRPVGPVAATQLAPSMPVAASGQPPAAPFPARASARTSSGRSTGIGIAVVVAALGCIGLFVLLGAWLSNYSTNSQVTQQAVLQETLDEREHVTSTFQAQATLTAELQSAGVTQTAQALAQQTAQAQSTIDAHEAFLASLETGKGLVYGPSSGSLEHNPDDDQISYQDAEVSLRNFIVEARFTNPYATSVGDWDYGFIVRDIDQGHYRLVILSDKTWELHKKLTDQDGVVIAQGRLPDLDDTENGTNLVRLVAKDNAGHFFLNGQYVAELNFTEISDAGTIWIASGVYQGDEVAGYVTAFSGFTVWSLP